MIPLVDDYLQSYLVEKLRFLKAHPNLIDKIFMTSDRTTLKSLKDFISKKSIKVVIGYPKDQTTLPCYVINLAPENEVPLGLGDGEEEFIDYEGGIGDEPTVEELTSSYLSEFINGTYMNSNYRIECWSDNGDLTSYMYVILKWCLWTSRYQMLKDGWVNIRLSGTDLEPVPDYMPIFIYRRSAMINLQYENLYYNDLNRIKLLAEVLEHPDDYSVDEDMNIIDKDGNIAIPSRWVWVIRSHIYYKDENDEDTESKLYSESILHYDDEAVRRLLEKLGLGEND